MVGICPMCGEWARVIVIPGARAVAYTIDGGVAKDRILPPTYSMDDHRSGGKICRRGYLMTPLGVKEEGT
jgi:hypothetical protein